MATFAKWAMACETAFWPEGAFVAADESNMTTAVDDVVDLDKAVRLSGPSWSGGSVGRDRDRFCSKHWSDSCEAAAS